MVSEQTLSLGTLDTRLARFGADRGWGDTQAPRNLFIAMNAEVGELCEIFQSCVQTPPGLSGTVISINVNTFIRITTTSGFGDSERIHVGEEVSDVLIYLVQLSRSCHVDLLNAALTVISSDSATATNLSLDDLTESVHEFLKTSLILYRPHNLLLALVRILHAAYCR
ncbi:hypothetical protein HK100_007578 [Physocladia obscura]|uniref:Uncharacterized protein n=1 Tax=Physocladia obscura TaxID=109957 RepID=A0AAD5X6U7_9FUNG|nr:hypothetical protein HK100_007578 [Physocladia obscura]